MCVFVCVAVGKIRRGSHGSATKQENREPWFGKPRLNNV